MRLPDAVALLAVVAACHRAPSRAPGVEPVLGGLEPLELEGELALVGSDPATQIAIQPSAGVQVAVLGPLREELAPLVGFRVRLGGVPGKAAPPLDRSVVVRRYEVVAFRGEPVLVGTLRVEGSRARLEGRTPAQLETLPSGLRGHEGALVYLFGPVRDGIITVTGFGIIRPAPGS
jgi:hypothetical protein